VTRDLLLGPAVAAPTRAPTESGQVRGRDACARIGELGELSSNLRKIGSGLSTDGCTIVSQGVVNL